MDKQHSMTISKVLPKKYIKIILNVLRVLYLHSFKNEFFKSSNFGVSMLFELTWDVRDELRYLSARFEKIGDNTFRYVFDVTWA